MNSYVVSLWRGEIPLARVFWEYMIGWATLLNLLTTGAALIVFMKQGPLWLGLLLHFGIVPLNAFLLVSVWRASEHDNVSRFALPARIAAIVWFIAMLAI